ncbi:MAG: hypothetical protein IIB95_09070 [Candidatus Marinimicrobia bacterium]|nr:hypothetical protein [Candidatus Neomarinimicrobiota bacterium]
MKKTIISFITGVMITTSFFVFIGASEAKNDSLHSLLLKIEEYLENEIGKKDDTGRYQLQSFSIDRTHWHYLLDTATGELFRLEPSRTPENGKWSLMSAANFEKP